MNEATRRDVLALAGSAGLLAAAGSFAAAEEQPPDDRWRAWAVTQGNQTRLVVEGIYEQGGPGVVAIVKEASPQGTNPKILILELKTAALPGFWPQVIQPIPAQFVKAPYRQGQYASVEIRYPRGRTLTIEKILDTGAGPE